MKHSTKCKIAYALWTIPMHAKCWMKGINVSKKVFFGGSTFFSRCKDSAITIGSGCRFMSLKTGNLVGLYHRCMLSTGNVGAKLTIGNGCSFSGVSIWCFKSITLGDNVRVGANVTIMDGDAHQDDPRSGANAPVVIEDNVWIGAGVIVLKGVRIGRNSLVGAGSVVTKDIPANSVAAGNPCKVIKTIEL